MAWRTFIGAHWPALRASDLFTSVVGALREVVIHAMALLTELPPRRTAVHLAMGRRLSAAGDADLYEQVHGVVAISQLDSRAAPRGQPLVRAAGSGERDSRPQTEPPRLHRPVRTVEEGEGLNQRRVSSAAQTPQALAELTTRCPGECDPQRLRSELTGYSRMLRRRRVCRGLRLQQSSARPPHSVGHPSFGTVRASRSGNPRC
jgi:hypothetical protein